MAMKKNVTLYFTKGANPTKEDIVAMGKLPGVRQRNAALVDPAGKPERCDFVAGPAIPANYEDKPRAKPVKVETDGDDGDDSKAPAKKTATKGAK